MKKFIYILVVSSFIFQSCLKDNEDPVAVSPLEGAIVNPSVGGATEPNQIWFDLSSATEVSNRRTDWDFAFYSGDNFKVILNSSIMMAADEIPNATDIDQVKESDVTTLKTKVLVANFDSSNTSYVDDVNGNFPTGYTAISEISATDSENSVYLVNMGKDIYNGTVTNGSVTYSGDSRGWMKVQIVRSGDSYKIKYADIADTTHKEVVIAKNTSYNYTFFSAKNTKELLIQPEKLKWDLCFTVFTNIIEGAGTYIYADFVTTNIMAGAGAYMVTEATSDSYNNFKASDIDVSKFSFTDHRTIGANWRTVTGTNGLEVYGDRFYIVKDPEGFYYKLRFLRMTSEEGERGYPQFEYEPL